MKRHVQRSHDDNDGAAHQSIESATVSPMPNEMCESPTRKLPWPVSLHSGASKAAQTTLPAMGNEIFSNGSCDQIIGQDSSMQFYYTLLGPISSLGQGFINILALTHVWGAFSAPPL